MDIQELENILVEFTKQKEGKEFPIHDLKIGTAIDFIINHKINKDKLIKKRSVKQEIIDIIRKFYLTNEIKTYDQCAEEIMRLFSVVVRSEQLVCCCDNPNGFKEMEEGRVTCSKCKKPY